MRAGLILMNIDVEEQKKRKQKKEKSLNYQANS